MKRSPRFLSRSLRGSLLPLTSLSFAFLLALRSRREDDRTGGKVAIHVIDLESVSSNELTQGSKVSRPRSPPHSHTAFASKTCAHAPARAPALTTDRALLCWRAASSFLAEDRRALPLQHAVHAGIRQLLHHSENDEPLPCVRVHGLLYQRRCELSFSKGEERKESDPPRDRTLPFLVLCKPHTHTELTSTRLYCLSAIAVEWCVWGGKLRVHGKLSECAVSEVLRAVCTCLEYLHDEKKVAHQKIRASSVLLDSTAGEKKVSRGH